MWRIHLRSSELAICHFGECDGCDAHDGRPHAEAAPLEPLFHALKGDAIAMPTLRQIVQRHDLGVGSVSRFTDDQVATRIERMIDSGCLRLCPGARTAAPVAPDQGRRPDPTPLADPPPRARVTPARAPAPRDDVHWIEIEMHGEDGRAIAGQEYLVVTPDKRRITGVTDSSGRARLDGLVAGQCSVSFRNLDKDAWRVA